jgi:NADH-quinone oxidoreductase subunit A
MLSDFGMLLLFIIGALGFIGGVLFAAKLLRPARPNVEKNSTYESGEAPTGNASVQFNIRFYVIALVFVLFDVELAFLFPWATVFGQPALISQTSGLWGWFALAEMTLFVALLALGLAYVWAKGYIDWLKPDPKLPTVETSVPAELYRQVNRKYRPLLVLLPGLLLAPPATAQTAQTLKLFRASITLTDSTWTEGLLYDLTDSTLTLAPETSENLIRLSRGASVDTTGPIAARTIKRITIWRRNALRRGLLIGGGIGLAGSLTVAAIYPPATGNDFLGLNAVSNFLRAGLIGATVTTGLTYGIVYGITPQRSISVQGQPTAFSRAVPRLRLLSIQSQRLGRPVRF